LLQNPKAVGLKGGLENAVRQAEERGFEDMLIVDADCHQAEPFTAFAEYLGQPYKRLILAKDPEVDPWLGPLIASSRASKDGANLSEQHAMKGIPFLKRPETTYPQPPTPSETIERFTRLMLSIGIKRSLVLPNSMLTMAKAKPEFEYIISKAFLQYMLDNFLGKYPEISTVLYLPTQSPEKAAELIDDYGSEKGIAGVMISAVIPKLAGDEVFDPIYHAARKKGLPVCFHGATGRGIYDLGLESFKFIGAHALGFPISIIRQLTSLVLHGVPARFPGLKFVFMEGGITWIPWIMNRLDDEFTKRRLEAPLLTKLPSEYMKEFYYTSQPLEQSHKDELEHVFRLINAEKQLLYASDYPHWDFDVPSVIYDLPFLTEKAKKRILGQNAADLFRI
jgi:predicted TIM-barrel fold metal-dependent hydrolase